MPPRPSKAATAYARRGFKPMVGPLTAQEFDSSCGYTTGVGALARAAHWRLAMRDPTLPRAWCRAAHAACIADARCLP
jgi:hypothetical protein